MGNIKFGKMEHYCGSVTAKPEIDCNNFEQVREALLHSHDGMTTFDGRTFGSPKWEAYTPPQVHSVEIEVISSKSSANIGYMAIQESVAA